MNSITILATTLRIELKYRSYTSAHVYWVEYHGVVDTCSEKVVKSHAEADVFILQRRLNYFIHFPDGADQSIHLHYAIHPSMDTLCYSFLVSPTVNL